MLPELKGQIVHNKKLLTITNYYYFLLTIFVMATPNQQDDHPGDPDGEGETSQLNSFKKHLTCLLCDKLFENPKTLFCLHSFCEECLQKVVEEALLRQRVPQRGEEDERLGQEGEANDDNEENDLFIDGEFEDYMTIPASDNSAGLTEGVIDDEDVVLGNNPNYFHCPLEDCDGSTQVPLTDIGELSIIQVNVPLCNIERTMIIKEDLPKGRVLCESCQERAAIGVCCNLTCNNRPFCGDCLEIHLRERRKEQHCIVYPKPPGSSTSLESSMSEQNEANGKSKKDWEHLKQSDVFCSHDGHGDCLRNIYCRDHDEVICMMCTALHTHHAGCNNRYSTKDIYPECYNTTETTLKRVCELHDNFKGALVTTGAIENALVENVKRVKESVVAKYEELKTELQNQRDELIRKANRVLDLKSRELNDHRNMLTRVSSTFSRSIDFVMDFMATAIPSEFMMLKTQINNWLGELETRYTNYHRTPLENDCIYFKKSNIDMSNAIGQVYSTPSTKKFHIHPLTPVPTAHHPSYFIVTARDIIRTNVHFLTSLPELRVTIRHLNDAVGIEGFISCDKKNGKYMVTVCPYKSGRHEICIFEPMKPPYDKCFIGGRKIIVNVSNAGLLPFVL